MPVATAPGSQAATGRSGLPPGCVAACPGCRHRELDAAASRAQKLAYLRQVLEPWQDRLHELREPVADRRLGYRDKTTLHCEWQAGPWRAGLRRRLTLIEVPDCPVHSGRIRAALRLILPRLPPPPDFRLHYYVQAGAQITLVLKQAQDPPVDWLDAELIAALQEAGIEAVWLQLYPSAGYHKFSKRGWRLAWGQPRSTTRDGLVHGPESFQQLLGDLHRDSLAQAAGHLQPDTQTRVLDLYCGLGASLRQWLAAGAEVLGVELNGEALDCARRNAPAARLLRGACAQRLPQIQAWLTGGPQRLAVYANPPRSGLEPAICDWLAGRARPNRLAYLSCSAGTLARDLRRLQAAGYRVTGLQPYDFFPLTQHVEVLACLQLD